MTGGGFGGCAIAMSHERDVPAVRASVERAYGRRGWAEPQVFRVDPADGATRLS
jgi:galactokinase